MSEEKSHLTEYTRESEMQGSEEAALLHMWRVMGYGDSPGLPSYERHPEFPIETYIEPIVPTITLTEPTPPSSQQASDTSQGTTSQAMASAASEDEAYSTVDQRPQKLYQSYPPTPTNHPQYSGLSTTLLLNPPLRFTRRPAGDYQTMLQAMMTGNFDTPVFGVAGAAFQHRLAVQVVPTTPSTVRANVSPDLHQQRTWAHVSDIPPIPDTPTPRPKKRKCAQTPHDPDGQKVERAPKKPTGKKKKDVSIESPA